MKILTVLILAIVSVVYLFLISKLLGKKQIAQLEFIDYVIGISIGSIAAEMATDLDDTPWYIYIIAMTIFFLFDMLISYLSRKAPRLKNIIIGKPLTIIYKGEIMYDVLYKSKLDINELLTLCRIQGYFDISQIAYAVFETNGELSILPKADFTPTTTKDLNIQPSEPTTIPTYLVMDGRVSYSALRAIEKGEEWLAKKLEVDNLSKKSLKEFLLVQYDDKNNEVIVTKKNKGDLAK